MSAYTPKFYGKELGAVFVQENATGTVKNRQSAVKEPGALASTITPAANGKYHLVDVIKDYRWTLSNLSLDDLNEIPYVQLKEYKCTDSTIKLQFNFYSALTKDTVASALNTTFGAENNDNVLSPYEKLWPRDEETGLVYKFPYFNKTGLELGSTWDNLDPIGDSVKKITGGIGDIFRKGVAEALQRTSEVVQAGLDTALMAQYPSVGVTDRPKIFMSHNDRTINISFVLYNTYTEEDCFNNRDLLYTIMSQNLFNKRDFTTGVPPVFYSVFIPGQYFSYASYVSNYKVENLGNQRLVTLGEAKMIMPDAYQIDIALTELVKPSKNQYEALVTGVAEKLVSVSTR